jgi:hypothetical protein
MSFFEPPPRPPEPVGHDEDFEEPEWMDPLANVLGTPVPLRFVLATTEDVSLAVTHADA